jgi:hypothetical protein
VQPKSTQQMLSGQAKAKQNVLQLVSNLFYSYYLSFLTFNKVVKFSSSKTAQGYYLFIDLMCWQARVCLL